MSHTFEQHFEGRSAVVRDIYDTNLATVNEFGPANEHAKKSSIHLNRKSAFGGVQIRREFLILTVKATDDISDPRISKREQASAHRWHHEIKIASVDSIDSQIIGWLRDSYELSG